MKGPNKSKCVAEAHRCACESWSENKNNPLTYLDWVQVSTNWNLYRPELGDPVIVMGVTIPPIHVWPNGDLLVSLKYPKADKTYDVTFAPSYSNYAGMFK